ncbi:MAG: HAMP domain-containing protein [Oxalobacter sp.]|nr:MAG: HAMP domain-containing protein [Oxalobacter sp.]
MKRFFRDTIFFRLFALVFAALIISHLATIALVAVSFRGGGERLHGSAAMVGMRPPPPPHLIFSDRSPPLSPHEGDFAPPPFFPPGLWIGLATQFFALMLAAWFGAKVLVRPIQRLAKAAARLGTTLNSPMIEEAGPLEARRAARVFNQMQERIRSQIEERARFLAAVSHDLRTPLTRMKLRMERPDEKIQRDRLLADIEEMSAMLNATLEYFRGAASLERPQLLDVQALVDSMAENATESGHEVSVLGTAAAVVTLPMALRRCLLNLLENALRYGESAQISLMDSPENLVIDIRDKGPGIPFDKLNAVFEPFVRLETSRNKATGGVGLGLAIAKEAASQCGGQLILKNIEGGGLSASITLSRRHED